MINNILAATSMSSGALFLLGAILCASLFSILFKICQQKGLDSCVVIFLNYTLGFVASLISATVNCPAGTSELIVSLGGTTILLTMLQGVLYASGFVIMDSSVWRSGVALTTTVARSSLVLPVLLSALLLGQDFPAWYSILLVLISLILIVLPNKPQTHDSALQHSPDERARKRRAVFLLVSVFLTLGISDFMLKVTQNSVSSQDQIVLLSPMIFFFASLFSFIFCVVKGKFGKRWLNLKTLAFGMLLGTANMVCTDCSLRALSLMPTAVFYPLYNIGIVIVGAVAGVLAFKEKLTLLQIFGIMLALVAVALLG